MNKRIRKKKMVKKRNASRKQILSMNDGDIGEDTLKKRFEEYRCGSDKSLVLPEPKVIFERPKGEWIVVSNGTTNHYACSKCGHAGDFQDKFCRECGADMRGERGCG